MESVTRCHQRVKEGLDVLLDKLDKEDVQTVLLAGHAASVIAAVRVLLDDVEYPVRCGTASVSKLVRKEDGSWELTVNGDASHLKKGEQRSWMFSGDVPDYEKNKKVAN